MTRQFIRLRPPVQGAPFDTATAFREALAADGAAELWDAIPGAEPRLVFTLRAEGIAVLVVNSAGRRLGTFADPLRAVVNAFATLDRAAAHQRAARPRPTRARGRITKELRS